jgi:prophage regulatory protein
MHLVSETRPQVKRDRLLKLPEVEHLVALKKSTIYNLVKQGKFPRCVQQGPRSVAWKEADVLQWVQDRISESEVAQQQPVKVQQ